MAEVVTWVEVLQREWKQALDRVRELEEQNRALRERLELLRELEETDRKCREAGFDGIIDLAGKLQEKLAAYQEMFVCPVCHKPLNWSPDDNLGMALKAFVKEHKWIHSGCSRR